MARVVRVRLDFFAPHEGGYANVPSHEHYLARPIRLAGERTHWTLVVKLDGPVGSDRIGYGEAKFLVDAAPHERLVPGAVFTMVNGSTILARGEVLPNPSETSEGATS